MKLITSLVIQDKATTEDIITKLLKGRGISKSSLDAYFAPLAPKDLTSTQVGVVASELKKSLALLESAYSEKKRVVIWSDYDVDGVCGAAIMWQTLHMLGFDVMPYISDRKTEGYGFSQVGIEKVIKHYNPALIISVDHGISGEEHIKTLAEKGVSVIIVDHHLKTREDPMSAKAILYTQAICGAGVAYFVSREIFDHFRPQCPEKNQQLLDSRFNKDFVVLSGIATIADMMKLTDYNRSLAYHGLKLLPSVENIGLKELLKTAGVSTKNKFGSFDIGFVVGPRINAAGRIGDAIVALRLLCTGNNAYARQLALELEEKNKVRQGMLQEQLDIARVLVSAQRQNPIIFIHSDKFDEGVVGLIAARIMRDEYRPTLVASVADGHMKGSARSVRGVHIVDILKKCRDELLSYGGHEMAGGFSLSVESAGKFHKKLLTIANKEITKELLEETVSVDLETGFCNITLSLATALEKLEPYGQGNEEPVFLTDNVRIVTRRHVGRTNDHVQLTLRDDSSPLPVKAIFFNGARALQLLDKKTVYKVVYKVSVNRYGGKSEPVLHVKEIV